MTQRPKRLADFRTGVLLTPQGEPEGYNQDRYVVGRTTLNHRIHILPISKVAKYSFYLTNQSRIKSSLDILVSNLRSSANKDIGIETNSKSRKLIF